MTKLSTIFATLFIVTCFVTPADATLIRTVFAFGAGDDSDVSGLQTQSVTAAADTLGNTITFDVTLRVFNPNGGGAVYDTSYAVGGAGGLSLTAGQGLQAGDEIGIDSLSITNFNGDADGDGRVLTYESDFTFRFLGTLNANGSGSQGTVITPSFVAGSSDWQDANGPGSDFFGHLPGTNNYITDAIGGNVNVSSGFDLQNTNAANGGSSSIPITSFSHLTVASNPANAYRLNNIVVEVTANPEPSSMLLGLVAVIGAPLAYGRKRFRMWNERRARVTC